MLRYIVSLLLLSSVVLAQQPMPDLERTQDLLIKQVDVNDQLSMRYLEAQRQLATAKAMIEQILKAESIDDVDAVLAKYGLERKPEKDK